MRRADLVAVNLLRGGDSDLRVGKGGHPVACGTTVHPAAGPMPSGPAGPSSAGVQTGEEDSGPGWAAGLHPAVALKGLLFSDCHHGVALLRLQRAGMWDRSVAIMMSWLSGSGVLRPAMSRAGGLAGTVQVGWSVCLKLALTVIIIPHPCLSFSLFLF
jgi:hypothetical protein